MKQMICVIGQEQGQWCSYLQDYPDQKIQAELLKDLQAKLRRLHGDRAGVKSSGLQGLPRAA